MESRMRYSYYGALPSFINFIDNQKQLIILDDCSEEDFNYAKYDGESISVHSL